MANPQKENGYTALSNEIVDKLCHYRISGEEWLILWVVLRKTYGWNKLQDQISLSQFVELTQLKRASVVRAIHSLVAKMLLCSSKNATGYTTTYSFQKDYEKWKVVAKKLPSSNIATKVVAKVLPKVVALLRHTKDIKPTIQKTRDFLYLEDTKFNEAFVHFIEMRKQIKKKTTPRAEILILEKLHKEPIEKAIAMLEQSVERSWSGVFPVKEQYNTKEVERWNKL